ncbi:hypothetical protein [Pseudonocardia sp.]|uniref:hypothetical protein n=1 Tax=Pseudonocardia sp. TaxID=60912 RepID=UPI0031FBA531
MDPAVPYTSHNSAMVLLVEDPPARVLRVLPGGSSRSRWRRSGPAADSSDASLCVAAEDAVDHRLMGHRQPVDTALTA